MAKQNDDYGFQILLIVLPVLSCYKWVRNRQVAQSKGREKEGRGGQGTEEGERAMLPILMVWVHEVNCLEVKWNTLGFGMDRFLLFLEH